jgi:hypothetical protein
MGIQTQKCRMGSSMFSAGGFGGVPPPVRDARTGTVRKLAAGTAAPRLDPDARNGLTKSSSTCTFQIRFIAQEWFVQRMGEVAIQHMR